MPNLNKVTLKIAVIVVAVATTACGGSGPSQNTTAQPEGVVCTANVVPALVVSVHDVNNHQAIACDAVVTVFDGAFHETLVSSLTGPNTSCDEQTFYGPAERAGTYRVVVQKPNYRDWVQDGVVVTADVCHVQTVPLDALLQH